MKKAIAGMLLLTLLFSSTLTNAGSVKKKISVDILTENETLEKMSDVNVKGKIKKIINDNEGSIITYSGGLKKGEYNVNKDSKVGSPIKIIEADRNVLSAIKYGGSISDALKTAPIEWEVPVLLGEKGRNDDELTAISASTIVKSQESGELEIVSFGTHLSREQMDFLRKPKAISNFLKDNSINEANYIAVVRIGFMYSEYVYLETESNEYFIPIVHSRNEREGLINMKLYTREQVERVIAPHIDLNYDRSKDMGKGGGSSGTSYELVVNGEKLSPDISPIAIGGYFMVPLRDIFEALDFEVGWDEENSTINITKNETVLTLKARGKVAYKNGEAIELEAPATIVYDKVMIPLSMVSDVLNASTSWDQTSATVKIDYK